MLEGHGQAIRLEPSIYVASHFPPTVSAKRLGLLQRYVRRVPIPTMQIGDEVSGDGVQPGQQRPAPDPVCVQLVDHSHKDVAGKVLGQRHVTHPVVTVAIHRIIVPVV
jgi:hypothetical protein